MARRGRLSDKTKALQTLDKELKAWVERAKAEYQNENTLELAKARMELIRECSRTLSWLKLKDKLSFLACPAPVPKTHPKRSR